jgi:hypothetical protein
MRYPRGSRTDGVIKVIGALEGLKESNEIWYHIVDDHLRSRGFKTTPANPCIYVRDAPEGDKLQPRTAFILVHVDDFTITASEAIQQEIYADWPFKVKIVSNGLGPVAKDNPTLLGMGIAYDRATKTITIDQETYITEVHAALKLDPRNVPVAPLKPRAQYNPSTGANPKELATREEARWYRQACMSALWVARLTKPTASFPCQHLAGVNHEPTAESLSAIKDVWGYLYRHRKDTITYSPSKVPLAERNRLIAYVDSDWAADKHDRRSITGYAIFLNGAAVAWRSAKQKSTADSSCSAEMYALAIVLRAITPLKDLITLMGYGHLNTTPTTIYEDNQAVIQILKAGFVPTKHRHIDVASQICREGRDDRTADYQWIPTELNLADTFTKNVDATSLERARTKLTGNAHVDHPLATTQATSR